MIGEVCGEQQKRRILGHESTTLTKSEFSDNISVASLIELSEVQEEFQEQLLFVRDLLNPVNPRQSWWFLRIFKSESLSKKWMEVLRTSFFLPKTFFLGDGVNFKAAEIVGDIKFFEPPFAGDRMFLVESGEGDLFTIKIFPDQTHSSSSGILSLSSSSSKLIESLSNGQF
ncbi:hypothetical protein L6452_19370 [Arctium lappa]|uniref:Uncharacterized protein n=1 Tax=Arctium lappa TaxID=4217 RepID=A0ACB9B9T1_ARCLA|nr:hypothetical protein L6452_19370 [Arctium lappa]